MNNQTTIERYSRKNNNENQELRTMNSGIKDDHRIIVDSFKVTAGIIETDMEFRSRLLSSTTS